MAKELLMPKFGQSVESSVILDWKKKVGDQVKAGEVICEIETDKAAFEVEANADGELLKILYDEGQDVPVLTPIAIIGAPGEQVQAPSEASAPAAPIPQPTAGQPAAVSHETQAPLAQPAAQAAGSQRLRVSPRARNLARQKGVELPLLRGSGPGGRIIERDVLQHLSLAEPMSPAAQAVAAELQLQAPPTGSGIGGRVVAADLSAAAGVAPRAAPAQAPQDEGPANEIPLRGIRKLIAERMLESLQTTAQLTLTASVDATRISEYRKRLKSSPEEFGLQKVTINDLLLCAVAKTLPRFMECNAYLREDKILQFEYVHLAFAVDAPRGLMVPVIRNAQAHTLRELSVEAARLRQGCLEGDINPDELSGGTFTVSNLGVLGIESFTPILNPPQVGILGVCAIQLKPVQRGEEVAFIPAMNLSLTINHQAVDGGPAARFLNALCQAIADIDLTIAE